VLGENKLGCNIFVVSYFNKKLAIDVECCPIKGVGLIMTKLWLGMFFFMIGCNVSTASNLNIEIVSPMKRVFKHTDINISKNSNINIWVAKNEYENIQIALNSKDKLNLESVYISDFKNKKTAAFISSDNCSVLMPDYVRVEWNTKKTPIEELDGRAPDWYPDPLPKFKPVEFTGTRALWLTCYVSSNAIAGAYSGEFHIETSEGSYILPIELNVWDFSLPDKSALYTTNWLHTSQLVKHYSVRKNSGQYWELIDYIADDMKKHRQNVIYTQLDLVKAEKLENGNYAFDFSLYEQWVNIFSKHGFQAFEGTPVFHPSSYHIVSEVTGKKKKFNKKTLSQFLHKKEGKEYLRQFFKALHIKNIELKISDKFLQHVGDEAREEHRLLYRDLVKIIHKKMPNVPIIDATHLTDKQRIGMMDIPVTNMYINESKNNNAYVKRWGKWWYTAGFKPRGKMPNRFIDYPLVKMRMLSWLAWRYGMSGYLHYGYNWWQMPSKKSPWEQTQYKPYAAGDGWIVYPPKNGKVQSPISSLRWEIYRDGVEDYEYFILLEKFLVKLESNLKDIKSNSEGNILLQRGRSLHNSLFMNLKSKSEYIKDEEKIENIRRAIGSWLNQVSAFYSD